MLNVPLGSPEYTGPVPAILGGGFPLPATRKGLEKEHSFNRMTRWIKTMIDGGILVHKTVLQVNGKSACVVMARDRLVKMCSSHGEQIPYSPLIRFGAKAALIGYHHTFIIIGPDQDLQ